MALDSSSDTSQIITADMWYLNIANGLQKSPTSFPNYIIKNGKLFRFMQSKCVLQKEYEWKEVIPLEKRTEIMRQGHSEPSAGHLGIFKTYKRLSLHYYWPKMFADVVNFVSKCDTCLQFKHSTHGTLGKMGSPKKVSRPFHTISVDFTGPYPMSRKQKSYLLVVLCCFSKYTMLYPLRHANAELVAQVLENEVFLVHGTPNTCIMDNAKHFKNKTLNDLFTRYKIPNVHYTPNYCPQYNPVERYNKSVTTAVASFIGNDQRTWDVHLPKIQFAINSAVNETTGFTPNFLVFGRELMPCGSLYHQSEDDEPVTFMPRDEYGENLGHLANIFDQVQKALYHAHVKNTASYNTRRKHHEFFVGDFVYRRTFFQSDKDKYFCKKLAPKYVKCRVAEKRSPLVYVLEEVSTGAKGLYHIKDMKPLPKHT